MSGSGGCCWGAEARALGHGGIRLVARAAGVREATVSLGVAELEAGERPLGRVRRPGGGRKRSAVRDPGLVRGAAGAGRAGGAGRPVLAAAVDGQVDPRTLAGELTRQGHQVSARHRRGPAARRGVQPAGQRQDDRGTAAPGPGRPVPLHQRAGQGAPGCRGPGDQRGHQEKGAGRRVRQRRAGSGGPRASRPPSATTTSPPRPRARRSRTGSTTWPRTPAG